MNPLFQIAADFRAVVLNDWQVITQASLRQLVVNVQRRLHNIAEVPGWTCLLSKDS